MCFPGCADLHLLDMLTPTERKRQGYIHELIVTEENYVNDLQLVTEVRRHGTFRSRFYSLMFSEVNWITNFTLQTHLVSLLCCIA